MAIHVRALHRRRLRLAGLLLASAVLATACSAGGGTATGAGSYPGWPVGPISGARLLPVILNSAGELAVGPSRFLFTLLDRATNAPAARPSITTRLAFYDLARDPATPVAAASGVFLWAVPERSGLYRAAVRFRAAGDWGVQITVHEAGQPDQVFPVQFSVAARSGTPALGEVVPTSETPTATTPAAIGRISSDRRPDPRFYAISERQALAEHRPFVLVIATPAFCQSQVCGPTLDHVKALAGPYLSAITFIHVEPYVMRWDGGGLQPVLDAQGSLQLAPELNVWNLPSEPWVFVAGADGRLIAKFEGAFGDDELQAALGRASGG